MCVCVFHPYHHHCLTSVFHADMGSITDRSQQGRKLTQANESVLAGDLWLEALRTTLQIIFLLPTI